MVRGGCGCGRLSTLYGTMRLSSVGVVRGIYSNKALAWYAGHRRVMVGFRVYCEFVYLQLQLCTMALVFRVIQPLLQRSCACDLILSSSDLILSDALPSDPILSRNPV